MTSQHWNDARAEGYRQFRYDFPEKSLADKTVIIAGGTGGLGAATVWLLAREGAHLVIGYRHNRDRANKLSLAVEKNFGRKPAFVEGDLREDQTRGKFLEAAQGLGNPIAGAAIFPGDPARVAFQNLNHDAVLASLESNYVGPILLAKELGEAFEATESGGSVVLLATMQALAPFQSSLNYAAPKAALVHAARILAQQWDRVRVNVVAPGATIVGMAEASVQSGKYDRHISSGAIARFGHAEDVARAVRFFLEPDNYITGQSLAVDGGLTLRRDRG